MLTDQWQGFTGLPDFPDPSLIPTHLKNAFDFLGSRAVPRYNTAGERDAELASPEPGQLAWVGDTLYVRPLAGTWQVVWQPEDPWKPLTLMNGWSVVTSGSARYRKDRAGNVHIQARINVGTSSSSADTPAFTLPAGYRHTFATFLRLPLGTNTLTSAASGYFYTGGQVAIAHNVSETGYVTINVQFPTL